MNKNAGDALLKLFWDEDRSDKELSIAFKLMVHLAQQTQNILSDDELSDLTFIQNNFDKIHQVFFQMVDTLFYLSEKRDVYR